MIQKLRYRLTYYKRRLLRAIGLCHSCYTPMNYTTTGRLICPNCGR